MSAEVEVAGAASFLERYRALTRLCWPKQYPLVFFPNWPLMVGIVASLLARLVDGTVHGYLAAVASAGFIVWASWEVADGANLFRRLLGTVVLVDTVYWAVARLAKLA